MNSKLHAVCDGEGSPIVIMLAQSQMSDRKGAVLLFDPLPNAKKLLGDKDYDSDRLRTAPLPRAAFISAIAIAATVIFWFDQ